MDVKIIRSNRKTVAIQVNSDLSITVRAPHFASEKDIEEILMKKEAWISKHIEEIKTRKKRFESESTDKFTPEKIKLLADKALEVIPMRVEYFANIMGVTYGNITIRNQKTRWGSCSSEKNLNFDQPVERRGTHSLKYDFAEERGRKKDILPLWVADMDFKTSSFVQEALIRQAEHGIYGYTESDQEYYDAVSSWMERRHGWKIDKEWITKTPGIVFALAMAVKAYTEPGDYILIQDPVYYPFREVIESNDRKVAANILIRKEDGSYAIDFEDFERQIVEKGVKLFLFCSPHNPVSRVWTREEVERLGDICLKHQVIIVSDEIHADFVFEGKHQVLVDLKDEYKDITVTCTSPGKTFNLAGLQISNIIIPNASLRKEFQHQVTAAGYSQVGAPGIFALIAAYTQGEEWYQAMKQYVKSNIDFLHTWMAEHLPQIKVTKTEGTYLVWMDFRALGLSDKELKELIEDKAEVWLDGGAIFGEPGSGFERINVACQRATLVEALDRIEKAVKENVHG